VTGYSQNLAQATNEIQRGARQVVNLRTHDATPAHPLRPSFLATSVKGVFRAAAAWLVERAARELGAQSYATCGYALAVPESQRPRLGVHQRTGLCPVCRVFGGTGCLSGSDVAPAQRQVGRVAFTFNRANDAAHGTTTASPPYRFAWEQVEGRGKPLLIEHLHFEPDTALTARVDDADDFALALLWLAGDLISSGFFRFGRFTSRGYGVVRLTPATYTCHDLASLLAGATPAPTPLDTVTSGYAAAQTLLDTSPHAVLNDTVQRWVA
jgi:CRISPR/Cas system CSM-associated protein Csm3 (group 7 of RAMP superfamily)